MSTLQENLKLLFQSVFWPAAAGNVFWSACTLLVDESIDPLSSDALARLAVLIILSTYLSIEWLRNNVRIPQRVPLKFWFADWLHVCAVVFVALSAAAGRDWLVVAGITYFTITAFGHFFNAWEAADASFKDRKALGLINLIGVGILIIGCYLEFTWHIAIGFLVVVGLWAAYRKEQICSLFKD